MMRIRLPERQGSLLGAAAIVSIGLHVGLAAVTRDWRPERAAPHGSSMVALRVVEAPRPSPVPEPPQAPKPEAVPTPPPPPPPKSAAKPRPNRRPTEPTPPAAEPAAPVFGVTADSVAGAGSGTVAVRVGNTLNTEMEEKATPPEQVKPLAEAPLATEGTSREPAPSAPVPIHLVTRTPSFKVRVEPVYPEDARRDEVEGVVQVEVLVDESGRVRRARALRGPGHGLDQAAEEAARASTFEPAIRDGEAVATTIRIPYRFVLDG